MLVPYRLATRLGICNLRHCHPRSLTIRPYHSYDHPDVTKLLTPHEQAILAAAYKHVPDAGFSYKSLVLGAKDAGYPNISMSVLADGPFSLIYYHLVTRRQSLCVRSAEILRQTPEDGFGCRVEHLAWERLLGNVSIISQWQEALAIIAQPTYATVSLKELAQLADDIWFLAGDSCVDASWYTKRASFSLIYASSELFMTNDNSPGFRDTREFLQRRLHEADEARRLLSSVRQWAGFTTTAAVNVWRSKGLRI